MLEGFLCLLTGGSAGALAVAPLGLIAWKYLRLMGMIGLALSAGLVAWQVRAVGASAALATPGGVSGVVAVLAMAVWVGLSRPDLSVRAMRACAAVAALAALAGAWTWLVVDTGGFGWPTPLVVVGLLAAAGVLGAVTTAWLLGHAYLTATRMTIAPLQFLSRLMSVFVSLRVAVVVGALVLMWVSSGPRGLSPLRVLERNWLIASLRAGVGLVALPVFTYMVADCVKRRATQAATGILYFASVFAYISELCGLYLLREVRWPL